MPTLIKTTDEQKIAILKRYLISKEQLKDIYEDYKDLYSSLGSFWYSISYYMQDKAIVNYVLKDFKHKFNPVIREYITAGCLGSKLESYYESEEDVLYNKVTFEDLSKEEQQIFNAHDDNK